MLRIEIDGHFHGSQDVPRPWVARIDGPSPKWGLQREFIQPMNDWRDASRACSGNTYGVMATFPLRSGHLYEVSRLRGRSSKRHVAREFGVVVGGKLEKLEPAEALERATGVSESVAFEIRDDEIDPPWVAEVKRVGSTTKLGFVVVDGDRRYALRRDGMYEVRERDRLRLVVTDSSGRWVVSSQREALAWLKTRLEEQGT